MIRKAVIAMVCLLAASCARATTESHSGSETHSGIESRSGAETHAETVTATNLNAIIFVDGTKYTDIASALAACPSAGCRVYEARTGTISVSANPFASITTPFDLFLCGQTYQTRAQWQLLYSGQHVHGCSTQTTTIQAVSGFQANTNQGAGCVTRIGYTAANGTNDTYFESVYILPLQTDPYSCGGYSDQMNEQSGYKNVVVSGLRQYGIHIHGPNTGDFILRDLNIIPASTATGADCLFLDSVGDRAGVQNITCANSSGSQESAGVEVLGQGIIMDIHCENYVDCVKVDAGGYVSVVGLNAHSNVTNAVHFLSTGSGMAIEISSGGGTNSILDDNNSVTLTEAIIPFYGVDETNFKATWQDKNGLHVLGGVSLGSLLVSNTAPTISSGFGTLPGIVHNNGTAEIEINVGTGGTATRGVLGLPAAANGWDCRVQDMSTPSKTTTETAFTTTSVTLTASAAWRASDLLLVHCGAF